MELAELLTQDGLGKYDVGRIERGKMVMQAIHRRSLAHHLRVPESWFTDPDTIKNRLDAVLDQLAALTAAMTANDLEAAQLSDEHTQPQPAPRAQPQR